jgi:hypothetical protein
VFAAYIVLGVTLRWAGWIHDDARWFVAAARKILDGTFDVYSFRGAQGVVPPEGATYAYSPLTAMTIAPFVGVADVLGWGQVGAERLMTIPLLVADVLALQQLRGLARAWRPAVEEHYLFAGVLVSLFLTSFLANSAYYSHNEGLMLLFLLLALKVAPGNVVAGGLWAGLAVATKQTMALTLLPVGLVLLWGRAETGQGERRRGGARGALVWSAVAGAVFAAFILVPLVKYPGQVYFAFVTQIARLPTFGPGLPGWVDREMQTALSQAAYEQWRPALLSYANWLLVGVVIAGCATAYGRARRGGEAIGLMDSRLLALVALAAVAQVAFGKWVSGHYYQVPLALVFLWDVVRRSARQQGDGTARAPALDPFPWTGLGAAVAFRAITQVGIWWFKDALLLALFLWLVVIAWLDAGRGRDE